ncbi:uncharacterized protein J7T54_007542 [Emericellopsis cladophorae]|uniref:Prefoldin subunit 1 n=1 Tax=Emericellopsis cladophorae TaxID=2686198 RepID=A0A9Q0BAP9_9HYPO|nr:uncharacterized protein J7T54_007542 [Emericellopsis cladophorae]KAI6779087.1 hypothetical protein J7T54_007542 [Emericellopsis cladophorae]
MSIPNEALQKLVHEIESQALVAQQQIGLTKSQVASKQREQRLIKLTLGEVSSLPDDTVIYEGVGKITTLPDADEQRFASLPVDSLREKLDVQGKDIEGEVEKLNKRLLYLETTQKNSREHIEQMLRGR